MCAKVELRIASYARVSYDEDKERYESIINQKNIVKDYAKEHFSNFEIIEYEDDNFSGYKFDRPAFSQMKRDILDGNIDVVIAKDLSRIGRHNAKTLLFIEELEKMDVTVIAINDDLDTSKDNNNDLVGIKTWYNELYVKDISRKIRSTVNNKSKNGTWITNVPYGYVMVDYQKRIYKVDYQAAQIVQRIFEMYISGLGYKRIAQILTDENVPTPKMRFKQLWEEMGKTYNGPVSDTWSIASINGIILNDFYIGTLRTNKYTRNGINGTDKILDKEKNYVFEDFHEPILNKEMFYKAQQLHEIRSSKRTYYRGTKKYDNDYTGFMRCGDCGAPMFSISNGKRKPAYYCGSYHRFGRSACTSHHIHVAVLDNLIKDYIKMIKENASKVVDYLNTELEKNRKQQENSYKSKGILETLKQEREKCKNELKVTMQQKIRDIMKNPDGREYIEDMYSNMENELNSKITNLNRQIEVEEKNNINDNQQILKAKKDALVILEDILKKDKLDKNDLSAIIDCIYVYENKIIIKVKSNIESILDIGNQLGFSRQNITAVQKNKHRFDRKFFTQIKRGDNSSNVVRDGDPLEIFTDREGQVILKKYSPIGELSEFATEYAETLAKTTGHIACITDKDTVIAVSGGPKKEFLEQNISKDLERIIDDKEAYISRDNNDVSVPITQADTKRFQNSQIVYPIISDGDAIGSVILISKDINIKMTDIEKKVAQSAATFLGAQMEL